MWRVIYWLFTGALLGFGFIGILSIGAPFLLLDVLLIVFGALKVGLREIWAALLCFGAAPAGILIWDVVSAPWACQGREGLPNVNYFSCVDTPFGIFTTYHVLAFFFGLIALAGLVWPLAQWLWTQARPLVV